MANIQLNRKNPIDVEMKAGETYYWCPCRAGDQHETCNNAGHEDCQKQLAFSARVDNTAVICNCKQTKQAPFCDGSHNV